jgi:hypothetical protein
MSGSVAVLAILSVVVRCHEVRRGRGRQDPRYRRHPESHRRISPGRSGTVILPSGNFHSGSLEPKSNVALHPSPGAVLWGSRNYGDYPGRALLWACGADNISIDGKEL